MKWYRDNWFYVGGILFVIQAFFMILWGGEMNFLKKLMVLSFMGLNVHQFAEYAVPGGFPMVMNMAFMGEKEIPERYPLNKKSAFVCNVGFMYPIYILSIIFSDQLWLGLTIVFLGVSQIFVHGIAFNKKMGTLYNPGMGSIVFIFIPLCIIYVYHAIKTYDVVWWHWVVALSLQPILGAGCLLSPINKLKDKNSPDIWSDDEIKRFDVAGKLAIKTSRLTKNNDH